MEQNAKHCTDQITRTRILLFNCSHVFFINLHLAFNDICRIFFNKVICMVNSVLIIIITLDCVWWCHFYVFQLFYFVVSTGIQNWHVFLMFVSKCHEWTSWLFYSVLICIAICIHNGNAYQAFGFNENNFFLEIKMCYRIFDLSIFANIFKICQNVEFLSRWIDISSKSHFLKHSWLINSIKYRNASIGRIIDNFAH